LKTTTRKLPLKIISNVLFVGALKQHEENLKKKSYFKKIKWKTMKMDVKATVHNKNNK